MEEKCFKLEFFLRDSTDLDLISKSVTGEQMVYSNTSLHAWIFRRRTGQLKSPVVSVHVL